MITPATYQNLIKLCLLNYLSRGTLSSAFDSNIPLSLSAFPEAFGGCRK
jgi:hypothetical protein